MEKERIDDRVNRDEETAADKNKSTRLSQDDNNQQHDKTSPKHPTSPHSNAPTEHEKESDGESGEELAGASELHEVEESEPASHAEMLAFIKDELDGVDMSDEDAIQKKLSKNLWKFTKPPPTQTTSPS